MGRLIHFLILFLPLLGNILFHFKVKLHSQGLGLKALFLRRKACLVFLWPCLSLCCALSAGMSMCILERYFWGPERPYGLEKSQLGSGIPFDSPKGLVVGPWN